MTRILSCSTALALVFSTLPAFADVTPEDVWGSWQVLAASSGQTLTFDPVKSEGGALVVTNLATTHTDDMGGKVSATIPQVSFKDNGDGTVSVTMNESYPLMLDPPAGDEGPDVMTLTVMQPGMTILVGGTPEAMSHDVKAPTLSVTLTEAKNVDGTPADVKANFVMTELAASYVASPNGDQTGLDSSFAAKAISLTIEGKNAVDASEGKVSFSLSDLAGTAKGTLLKPEVMENMAAALQAGFNFDSQYSFGAMAVDIDVTDETGPMKLVGGVAGGDFVLAIDKDQVTYGTALKASSFTASGAEIPFPEVAVGFSEAAFNVLMPVSKSETPQEFTFLTKLVDYTVSEDVWGMLDPAATLPRDPATVILDVKGTGFWKADIMDPAFQVEGAEPPGELSSLDLTQMLVKAAGAEVAGTGALTFDNTDLVTFQGVPKPTGTINIDIKGANALIDNLIAMGLLPEDQAMGARMMMGLFARPGAGPDELTSQIEFKNGGLFANGQQLQ